MKYQTNKLIVYDLEVYKNFFLCGMQYPDGRICQYEDLANLNQALEILTRDGYELCGFNSIRYDDQVMEAYRVEGLNNMAYERSYKLIREDARLKPVQVNSVDLMPLLPGRMSLKQVGLRLHHRRLQELPIAWDQMLSDNEKIIIREYNKNDLEITKKLLDKLQPELDLRGDLSRQYGLDLRSKGDASIAEVVISKVIGEATNKTHWELKKSAKHNSVAPVSVTAPPWFVNMPPNMGTNLSYILNNQAPRFGKKIPLDAKGKVTLEEIPPVYLDDKWYKLGIGGLHSVDGPGSYVAREGTFIMDIDVTSYYPAIILDNHTYPRHIEQHFSAVFRGLVEQRLVAKQNGDKVTADRLKITINGTFGKTSDIYSAIYDPQVLVSTTIIGQVSLLVLIAMLADEDLHTVSANTDGITVLGNNEQKAKLGQVVSSWERLTSFHMEYTEYSGIYYKDCNNYIAITKE